MTFSEKISEIRKEAIQKLIESGGKQIFDENNNELYEMPFVTYVDKYFNYYQYAIVGYSLVEGKVIFHTTGDGEICDDRDFDDSLVYTEAIAAVADLV